MVAVPTVPPTTTKKKKIKIKSNNCEQKKQGIRNVISNVLLF